MEPEAFLEFRCLIWLFATTSLVPINPSQKNAGAFWSLPLGAVQLWPPRCLSAYITSGENNLNAPLIPWWSRVVVSSGVSVAVRLAFTFSWFSNEANKLWLCLVLLLPSLIPHSICYFFFHENFVQLPVLECQSLDTSIMFLLASEGERVRGRTGSYMHL